MRLIVSLCSSISTCSQRFKWFEITDGAKIITSLRSKKKNMKNARSVYAALCCLCSQMWDPFTPPLKVNGVQLYQNAYSAVML